MATPSVATPSLTDDIQDTDPQSSASVLSPNKKKYYPFGTPNHGKVAFSDVAHLSPQNIQFVVHLTSEATKSNEQALQDKLSSSSRSSNSMKKMPSLVGGDVGDLSGIEGMPESEKGIAPCTRVDCKEVILSIIEIQKKNQMERDEIVQECEKMIQLHQQLEEEAALIEADNKRMVTEGNILELRMKTLQSRLVKSQTVKSNLDHDRDELNSKIMMMELEKQRTTRRSAEIQAALSEIMWKGSTSRLRDQPNKTPLYIKPYDPESHHAADNPSPTSYRSLVDDHLLDINERPKTVPLIPSELRLLKSMSITDGLNMGSSGFLKTSRDHLALTKSQSLHKTLFRKNHDPSLYDRRGNSPPGDLQSVSDISTASHVIKHRKHSPMAKLQSRTSTLPLNSSIPISSSSFKGYTPSGGKRTLGTISTARYNQTLTEQLERDLMSTASGNSLPGLDPVLYLERARTNWGRERKLGKVRLRNDPEGYRRKMLTSIGHPGIFGKEDTKEDEIRFLKTL